MIHDISFSGARILIVGPANYLVDKPAKLDLVFAGSANSVELAGSIVRGDTTENKKGVAIVSAQIDEKAVPLDYKLKIAVYLQKNPTTSQAV